MSSLRGHFAATSRLVDKRRQPPSPGAARPALQPGALSTDHLLRLLPPRRRIVVNEHIGAAGPLPRPAPVCCARELDTVAPNLRGRPLPTAVRWRGAVGRSDPHSRHTARAGGGWHQRRRRRRLRRRRRRPPPLQGAPPPSRTPPSRQLDAERAPTAPRVRSPAPRQRSRARERETRSQPLDGSATPHTCQAMARGDGEGEGRGVAARRRAGGGGGGGRRAGGTATGAGRERESADLRLTGGAPLTLGRAGRDRRCRSFW